MEKDGAAMTGVIASRHTLKPREDIVICVDVDAESTVEMKTSGTNGRPLIKLECIKQAITRFIHDKLAINHDTRFAFATLSKSAAWLKKEFTNDAESAATSLRGLSATKSSGPADLTLLFQEAAQEAKTSRAQNRILRVILIYCRSCVRPTHDWLVNQKLFTLDVMYLHDKPAPHICPQDVYGSFDDIIQHVSEYQGYIFESGKGYAQSVFNRMSMLLSYPPQRCAQVDLPKAPAKKPAVSCDKSASNSKKEVKRPLEKTPNTNTKRIHSLGKHEASDLKNYDEKLVGSRIKVWWPMDQKYYEAVVSSYDSAKKKHLVCYDDDGDQEMLTMRKEKWHFVNKSVSSEDEEANQTGCDEEAFTMPHWGQKKAKTSKEQSNNNQSMMDVPPEMFSPFPRYAKKDVEVSQVSRKLAEQVLSSFASQYKKYVTEAVKSSSLSLDKHSDAVDSIYEGAFNALKQEEVVANRNEEKQKATEVSTPELTCVPKKRLNLEHSLSFFPHDLSVKSAISPIKENGQEAVSSRREITTEGGVKTQERRIQQPVAEEEYLAETETQTQKRAQVESCSLHKAHGEKEKTSAEREPSSRSHKSNADPGELQRKKLPQPCSVTQQLAKVKQSILDTIVSLRQFRCELVTKEQSIVDTLSSVRQFRSEIQEKEDNLEASLLEIDVLGEKMMGINKILNSESSLE